MSSFFNEVSSYGGLDTRVFAILTVLGAITIFSLIAAIQKVSLSRSQQMTIDFLRTWGGAAPEGLALWFKELCGGAVWFGLLMCLTFTLNSLGDIVAADISAAYGHFGEEHTKWSVDHEDEWDSFKSGIRQGWRNVYDEDIVNDSDAWSQWKNERGKQSVRNARVLALYSVFLVVAGLIDLSLGAYRRRGAATLVVGLIFFTMMMALWSERKAHYIQEVELANNTLGEWRAGIPPNYLKLARTKTAIVEPCKN